MSAVTLPPVPREPIHPSTVPAVEAPAAAQTGAAPARAALLAALAYAVIALALFPHVVAHLLDAFPVDLGDPPSQAWIMAWDVHALATNPLHLYDGNIFYPFHDVLAYQDTLLGLLPLAAPVLLLTGNAVLAYNVLFLLSFALCAWGAYLLARLLTGDPCAAFLAGLVYGFSAYRMAHLSHLNLLSGMWIPFVLLCWERVRRGEARYWAGVGIFFVLQALSALYYAVFLAFALAVLLLLQLRRATRHPIASGWQTTRLTAQQAPMLVRQRGRLAHPRAVPGLGQTGHAPWPTLPGTTCRTAPGTLPGRWALVRGAALTAACCGFVLWPCVAPYIRVERLLGGSRGLAQEVYFAADLRDFLHSIDGSLLYGWTGHALGVRPGDALQYLWPGAAALFLALWGLRRGARPLSAPHQGYAVLLPVAAVLCLGPVLKAWGLRTEVPLPYLLLYPLPGFAGLRDPARFGAIYTLCLAVLAAYGMTSLLRAPRWRRPYRRALCTGLLCAGVLAESWIAPPVAVPLPAGAATPPVYRWLAAHPDGRAVLELPIGLGNKTVWARQAEIMYYATVHWHPIVNGTGGFAPPGYNHDAAVYGAFPAAPALHLLRTRGVRYVVVQRVWLGDRVAAWIRARAVHTGGVRLVGHWFDADLYLVR